MPRDPTEQQSCPCPLCAAHQARAAGLELVRLRLRVCGLGLRREWASGTGQGGTGCLACGGAPSGGGRAPCSLPVGEGLAGGGIYKERERRSLFHLRIFYSSCPGMGGLPDPREGEVVIPFAWMYVSRGVAGCSSPSAHTPTCSLGSAGKCAPAGPSAPRGGL